MGKYKMGMNDEKAPAKKMLLNEGWRKFIIVGCEEKVSKAGNLMFVFTCRDGETKYEDTWYAIGEPKKRWFLKQILAACGVKAGGDGVYDWDVNDVINRNIEALVVHEENEYINRSGETVKGKQHKIADVQSTEQTIQWDE